MYKGATSWSSVSSSLWINKKGGIYKNLQGSSFIATNTNSSSLAYPVSLYDYANISFRMKSGAMMVVSGSYTYNSNGQKPLWVFGVDVNGSNKGPNRLGRDVFHFIIKNHNKGLVPRSNTASYGWNDWKPQKDVYSVGCNKNSTDEQNGALCAMRIMKNGWKMDY